MLWEEKDAGAAQGFKKQNETKISNRASKTRRRVEVCKASHGRTREGEGVEVAQDPGAPHWILETETSLEKEETGEETNAPKPGKQD